MQQDEIQDKRGTASRTERKSDSARTSSTRDIKEMPRYDVGESNRVARNDTVRVSSQIPQSTSMGSFIVCELEGALTRINYSTLL